MIKISVIGKKTRMAALAVVALGAVLTLGTEVMAHKDKTSAVQQKAFTEAFMEQVVIGDLLFHGDGATEKKLGVVLSKTGMACAMCHPWASDTHPHEYPKYQSQMGEFAALRDMINWCIEKPNEGEKIDPNGAAMKAIEAYIYWSNRHSKLDPGRH